MTMEELVWLVIVNSSFDCSNPDAEEFKTLQRVRKVSCKSNKTLPGPQEGQLWLFQVRGSCGTALGEPALKDKDQKDYHDLDLLQQEQCILMLRKTNEQTNRCIRGLAWLNWEPKVERYLLQQQNLSHTNPLALMERVRRCRVGCLVSLWGHSSLEGCEAWGRHQRLEMAKCCTHFQRLGDDLWNCRTLIFTFVLGSHILIR